MRGLLAWPAARLAVVGLSEEVDANHLDQRDKAVAWQPASLRWVARIPDAERAAGVLALRCESVRRVFGPVRVDIRGFGSRVVREKQTSIRRDS